MNDDAAKRAGLIVGETGAQRLIGYVLDVGGDSGSARCWLDIDERHTNRHGVLHGGLFTVLLDNCMGATASLSVDPTGRRPFLTISLTTQFLAPARAGTRITASGRITGGGRSLLFIEGLVTDDQGAVLATAQGVFKRVPADRLPGPERQEPGI
ncbi:PaaI family thioesterase [Nitratireductor sp. ZSWI3]|uniref:PaaI family thioesterase n=1 Tax=Nitratireductor sp. ZSWI3 TaxID=2966359 RepID=UPI00214FA1E6|nr:PaaI family thioesterase [Nitratireductor sp. ZSWI3]MCR4267561.1 PaaI family thioesterase [Nitratireductor sp. ZSWI3]